MWVKECVCNEEHVCVSRACVQQRAHVFKGIMHIKGCVCNEEHMRVQGGTRSVCLKENMSCMCAERCVHSNGVCEHTDVCVGARAHTCARRGHTPQTCACERVCRRVLTRADGGAHHQAGAWHGGCEQTSKAHTCAHMYTHT